MLSKLFALAAVVAIAVLAACVENETDPFSETARLDRGNTLLQNCIETECQRLNLDGAALDDFSVLNTMSHVKVLMLSRTNITDLDSISGMTQLKELHIAWTDIGDISALPVFRNLDVLHVVGMNNVQDWTPAHRMTWLRELAIDADDPVGLSFVANMRQLEDLYVADGKVSDLSPLVGHPRLHTLAIDADFAANPEQLLQIPALRRITFDWFELDDDLTRRLEDKGVEVDQVPIIVC